MPLPFRSRSHGMVAFGFFNIEIDMLLLEQKFFFADRFCQAMVAMRTEDTVLIDGFVIPNRRDVGNVNGAINRWDLSGFIGATYEVFPFPSEPEQFKQSPAGARHRDWAAAEILRFGETKQIPVTLEESAGHCTIGDVIFDLDVISKLVRYVRDGGYPRWEGEVRPSYVDAMVTQLSLGQSGSR